MKPEAVAVCLISKHGRILLEQKRTAHANEPGRLVFPGGHIESGESPVTAARRELLEELGIEEKFIRLHRIKIVANYRTNAGKLFRMHYLAVSGWSGKWKARGGLTFIALTLKRAAKALSPERVVIMNRSISVAFCGPTPSVPAKAAHPRLELVPKVAIFETGGRVSRHF